MDQYRSRLKLSENFEHHWSILISGEIHMDQSLVHTFSWGNSYGPMVLKVLLKFPPTLVLVHGWEVLYGVGVDGVGVIFPFFYAFFAFLRIFSLFFRFSSIFFRFSLLLLNKGQGQTTAIYCKMGNFTPTPSAPTLCKTSRHGWLFPDRI